MNQTSENDVFSDLSKICIKRIKEFIKEQIEMNNMCRIIGADVVINKSKGKPKIDLHINYDDNEMEIVTVVEDDVSMYGCLNKPRDINIDNLMENYAASHGHVMKHGWIMSK